MLKQARKLVQVGERKLQIARKAALGVVRMLFEIKLTSFTSEKAC